MLEGIQIKSIERKVDERGFFIELARTDWKRLFEEGSIVQVNMSMSYPGIIRAWHRHLKGQIDNFVVIRGALKICVYDEETKTLDDIVVNHLEPTIIRIPGHYWHGFKVLGNIPALVLYFVNKLYNYENPDEERRPWNDPSIVPKTVNGESNDARAGKPWDWDYFPHK